MENRVIDDEKGYAIVLAIMILAALMIAGVMTSNTTITDLDISKNTVIKSQNEAVADSAAMACVQILENTTDKDSLDPHANVTWKWLNYDGEVDDSAEDTATDKWATIEYTKFPKLSSRLSNEGATIRYRAICWSPAQGASLGMYSDTLREGIVKGSYYTASKGTVTVEMGYKKRF